MFVVAPQIAKVKTLELSLLQVDDTHKVRIYIWQFKSPFLL